MLGAAGALCCLAAGTALGSWMRIRRQTRLGMLLAEIEALNAMRLMLEEERPALPELIAACADLAAVGEGAELLARRLRKTAQNLRDFPLDGVEKAYAAACAQTPAYWEKQEEKAALQALFAQLGSGTASMREQAVAACLRRLRPVCDKAQADAEKGGRLCMQLGLLLGLMAGIALW